MNAVADKLREARALIERGWATQALALDAEGQTLFNPRSASAVCWCALGALEATDAEPHFIYEAIGRVSIAKWNDAPERTQAEVLDAFDRAIALAEAAQ